MADEVRLHIVLTEEGAQGSGGGGAGRPPFPAGQPPAKKAPGGGRLAAAGAAGLSAAGGARALARNDSVGASRGAAGAISAIAPMSRFGMVIQAATAIIEPFAGVVQSFIDRGKELAKYSPDLALSGANAEIKGILADIREAQELGPDLARLQDAQTEIWEEIREALLPLKKWIVEVLASMMEQILEWTREARVWFRVIEKNMVELPAVLAASVNPFSTQASRDRAVAVMRAAIHAERVLAEAEAAARNVTGDLIDKQISALREGTRFAPGVVTSPNLGASITP